MINVQWINAPTHFVHCVFCFIFSLEQAQYRAETKKHLSFEKCFYQSGVGGVIGMSTPLICFRNHYERIIALFVKRICNSIAIYPFIA